MRNKTTDEDFIEIVKNSKSIAEVLRGLGLKEAGGNYNATHRRISRLNINTDHFVGQGWSKGQYFGPKRDIQKYLSNEFGISSDALRRRLIRENIKSHQCEQCKLTTWNGTSIPLELDHIDGNHNNNTLTNLRVLCPNCHAQTETYRGKNRKCTRLDLNQQCDR